MRVKKFFLQWHIILLFRFYRKARLSISSRNNRGCVICREKERGKETEREREKERDSERKEERKIKKERERDTGER